MMAGNCSPSESRALVVAEPAADEPLLLRATPPQAAFVAHLIASANKVPQFCDKRRAAPLEADAIYREAVKRFGCQ